MQVENAARLYRGKDFSRACREMDKLSEFGYFDFIPSGLLGIIVNKYEIKIDGRTIEALKTAPKNASVSELTEIAYTTMREQDSGGLINFARSGMRVPFLKIDFSHPWFLKEIYL